jgi:hypothetical protein
MTRVRQATPTVACIDDYCARYARSFTTCATFHNVRHFEQFTQLIWGMLAETKRKSLPRLAKTVQANPQALHHCLANADWSIEELRAVRLRLTRDALAGRPTMVIPKRDVRCLAAPNPPRCSPRPEHAAVRDVQQRQHHPAKRTHDDQHGQQHPAAQPPPPDLAKRLR